MLKNIFKATIRSLSRQKLFTLLNVAGLSIGITSFLLIAQFTLWDLSYDRFHVGADAIYRVVFEYYRNGQDLTLSSAANFGKVAPNLIADLPEVEAGCRIANKNDAHVEIGDDIYEEDQLFYAEQSLFDVFDYPVISGDRNTCLSAVNSVVINESLSAKYFGNQDPIGKTITLKSYLGEEQYLVTAIVRSPKNSHFRFSMIASFETHLAQLDLDINNNWNRYDYFTYIKLTNGSSPESVSTKLPDFIDKHGRARLQSENVKFKLQPLTGIHLNSNLPHEITENGSAGLIQFLIIVASFIIGIAWINYINLSTAAASNKLKEIGIRKTLGSSRRTLTLQFLFEAQLVNGLSIAIGLVLFSLFLRPFEQLVDRSIEVIFFDQPIFYGALFFFWIFSSTISGCYPAMFLSNLTPLKTLSNQREAKSGKWSLRNMLVIFQFFVSTGLIAGTLIVLAQIDFMTNEDLGINIKKKLALYIPNYTGESDKYYRLLENLKADITIMHGVQQVSISSEVPGEEVGWSGGSRLVKAGQTELEYTLMHKMTMDIDYLPMYQNRLVAGRLFEKPTDSMYTLLNRHATEKLGFKLPEDAIGQRIYLSGGIDTVRIIGVIEDYHQESLAHHIKPTAYLLTQWERKYISIESNTPDQLSLINNIQSAFDQHFPTTPFLYFDIEDHVASKYALEQKFLKAILLFSSLAIFIAILGLIGLMCYFIERHRKSFSIRKVLGSSAANLYGLLSKQVIKQIVLANILALPLIHLVANEWLDAFAYRMDFPWWTMAASFILSLAIAIGTISNLIFRLIKENPVVHLRSE